MALITSLLVLFLQIVIPCSVGQIGDFVSIDCGGTSNYTDSNSGLTWVSDIGFIRYGKVIEVNTTDGINPQYKSYRYFPADDKKYCYTLITSEKRRYLIRATFFYGDSNSGNPYPIFQIYMDSTIWSTVTIKEASRIYVEEMIIRATSTSLQVCMCCASTGYPFISTLELRPLNDSMYLTDYEDNFYLKVAARVNFGSLSVDPIRHLEDNKLSGPLPSYFAELPKLQELYVQNNSLSGNIPPGLLHGGFIINYENNPGLKVMAQHGRNLLLILITVVGAFVVIIILLLGCLWTKRKYSRRQLKSETSKKSNSLRIMSKRSTHCSISRGPSLVTDETFYANYYISLLDIEEGTSNLSTKIGEGSFGPVYYGKLKDGKEVAVKILSDQSSHGTQQFVNEVALLSRIHHKNLVPFVGFCEDECQRILVYEFMHNGTLRDHIHDSEKKKCLHWLSRLEIAENAAKGLAYLHNGCSPSIIHRDVKMSNILLDANMRAKVSDFGLSKQADENFTHVSSVARGTVGYLDPEYYINQQLTDKSDVYSFGIVLLELISGRKPFSVEEYGCEWNIVHWVRSLIRKGDIESIVDPSLKGTFKGESLWRVVEIAVLSVEPHGVARPRMQEVELAIQDAIGLERGSQTASLSSSSSSNTHALHVSFLSGTFELANFNSASNVNLPSPRYR